MSDAKLHAIDAADHAAITTAIRSAEAKTSGEIFAVVAHRSDDYLFVAGFFAGLWALVGGFALAYLLPISGIAPSALALVDGQAIAFLSLFALMMVSRRLRMLFVPRALAYRRASANAVRQFLAHGVHATAGRSGVLLFVSIDEHYAEVVADSGITGRVPQHEWNAMVRDLTEGAKAGDLTTGYLRAIDRAGALLAEHFPPVDGDGNELDDRLIEL